MAVSLENQAIIIHEQVAIMVTVVTVNGFISIFAIGIETVTDMLQIYIMQVEIQMLMRMKTSVGKMIVAI